MKFHDELCENFGIRIDLPDQTMGRDELVVPIEKERRGIRNKIVTARSPALFISNWGAHALRIVRVERIEEITVRRSGRCIDTLALIARSFAHSTMH